MKGIDNMEKQKPTPMKGLEVMCINNQYHEEQLTIGKKYLVLDDGALGDSIYIESDTGQVWEMSKKRFIL